MANGKSSPLEQKPDRLSLLADVARLVSTVPNMDDLLAEVSRVVHRAAESLDIAIGLLDPATGDITLQGRAGRYEQYQVGHRVAKGLGIAGWVADARTPVVCNDVSQDERYLALLASTASQLTIPLRWKDQLLGILVAESTEPNAFSEEDIRVFENLGHLISVVVENARLYTSLANSNTMLATLYETATEMSSLLDLDVLLSKVSMLLGQVVEHELFALLLVDEQQKELVWTSGIGYADIARQKLQRLALNQGIVGRVYQSRRPVLIGDVTTDPDYVRAETISGKMPLSALSVPLIFKDRVLGVLILESTTRNYFTRDHLKVVNTLGRQMAIAIENAQLYEEQHRDVLVQELLSEVGKEMSSILDLEELLPKIAALTKKLFDYKVFAVGLHNAGTNEIELKVAIGMSEETLQQFSRFPVGRGVMSMALRARHPVLIHDLREQPTRIPVITDTGEEPRSMIAVPLIYKERLSGVLAMQSVEVGFFRQEHVQTVTTLASQIAAALENAKLFQELSRREQKLEKDFNIARSMQRSMLPKSMPEQYGFEFATKYIPAEDLAGDVYDYLRLDEDRIGFFLGDVSGKGVSAALVMAASRSALRIVARGNNDPAAVLYTTNRQLCRDIRNEMYVAMFYGILNFKERSFLWSNAGHHPPFRISADNTVSRLSTGGTVLGLFDNARYHRERSDLAAGDIYVFYTDGVVDAEDRDGTDFGTSRLVQLVIANRQLSARAIRDKILRQLKRHTQGVQPHDDITLVILKCPD